MGDGKTGEKTFDFSIIRILVINLQMRYLNAHGEWDSLHILPVVGSVQTLRIITSPFP